jgi:hypothetical protein
MTAPIGHNGIAKDQIKAQTAVDHRSCTCHPDDRPSPCQRRFAVSECWRSAVHAETMEAIVALKNRDMSMGEQDFLDYLKRVERATSL